MGWPSRVLVLFLIHINTVHICLGQKIGDKRKANETKKHIIQKSKERSYRPGGLCWHTSKYEHCGLWFGGLHNVSGVGM